MSDDDKREESEAKSGQLIPGTAPLPLVAPTGQQRTLARLLSMLSTWPLRNRAYVEKLKTAKEVYEARHELAEAIEKHGDIRERLKDFGTTRDRGREERRRLLYEEKERRRAAENIFHHEVKMQDENNRQKEEEIKRQQEEQKIQRMEQEERELLLARELEELRKPPPEPEPAKNTTRGRSPKQKARDDAEKQYEQEVARIEKDRKLSAQAKQDLTKSAAKDREVELETIDKMP
jgi:hypothetical protein